MKQPYAEIVTEKTQFDGFNLLREYDLKVRSLADPGKFLAPINREVLQISDAVVVLIYVRAADSFLFCQQFRTGVFFNAEDRNPFIIEAPAGMIDSGLGPEDTAIKEVKEETGLQVSDIECFAEAYPSSGRLTEKNWLYYTEVDEVPETGIFGAEEEGEDIKTHLIKRETAYEMAARMEIVHLQTLLAIYWFKSEKDPHK